MEADRCAGTTVVRVRRRHLVALIWRQRQMLEERGENIFSCKPILSAHCFFGSVKVGHMKLVVVLEDLREVGDSACFGT